jgi:hypothetical protein
MAQYQITVDSDLLHQLFLKNSQDAGVASLLEAGLHLRVNRSIQAEGAFGVLKSDYRFNRFLTRGKNNVETELLLLCFGYNINKLHAKIQNKRLRTALHELRQTA